MIKKQLKVEAKVIHWVFSGQPQYMANIVGWYALETIWLLKSSYLRPLSYCYNISLNIACD